MRHFVVLSLLLLGCFGTAAQAATLYWDPALAHSGTGSGGNGPWDNTSAFWFNGSADQVWAAGSDAVLAGQPGLLNVNGAINGGGINANSLTAGDTLFYSLGTSGSTTHTIGTLNLGPGLFTFSCGYANSSAGVTWNIATLNAAQGTALALFHNNLGNYKGENPSYVNIANSASVQLGGGGAVASGSYHASILPFVVYAKWATYPWYNFCAFSTGSHSLISLLDGADGQTTQVWYLPPATPADNVNLQSPGAVTTDMTINSLVLAGGGYHPTSTADITGSGRLTISSGAIMFQRAPENFSNPVSFPAGVEGCLFINNDRGNDWTAVTLFSPTIRAAFSGDHGLTITGQPYLVISGATETSVFNPDPVTLTGSSDYTGTTTINAARVVTTIPANFGNSNLIVLNNGGTLAPTADNFLSGSQSLTMNAGSTLDVGARTTTVKDVRFNGGALGVSVKSTAQLRPSGAVTITAGTVLNLILDAAPAAGQQFTLVSGAQTITGTFAQGAALQASYNGTPHTFGISYVNGSIILTEGGNPLPTNPPVITTPPADIYCATNLWEMQGSPFSYQIIASNSPTSYSATGLPAGLSVDSQTGLIHGVPTAQGNSTVAVSATNGAGTGQATWTFKVIGTSLYSGTTTLTPYLGAPVNVPDNRVYCVNYDLGGEGVAYHDDDVGNHYVAEGVPWYRNPHDDVDITAPNSGTFTAADCGVGEHGSAGEWQKTSLNVTQSGTYNLSFNAGSANEAAAVHFEIDDVNVTGTIAIAAVGSWAGTAHVATAGYLAAGPHVLKLVVENNGGVSMNYVDFILTGSSGGSKPAITSATSASGTVGQTFSYQIVATNAPSSYSATGLPDWLSIDTGTGAIGGMPTAPTTATLTLTATNDSGSGTATLNITITSGSSSSGAPYLGTPAAIPGQILAVNFDNGGEGVAYHDDSTGDVYGSYYRTSDVDIFTSSDTGGGYCVAGFDAGEWMNYSVNVTAGGTYTVQVRYAAGNGAGQIHIEFDGVNVTGSMSLGNTGNWNIWATASATGINLTAGQHVMRIVAESAGAELNWVNFVQTTTTTGSAPAISSAATASGTVGTAFNYQIAGSNTPTSYSATGLPANLSVDTGSGAITGTPAATGTFTSTISASNAAGPGTATLTITIAKGGQSINFPPLNSHTLDQSPFTPAATAASGLPVTFSVVSGPATSDGTEITLTGYGTVMLKAAQAGDANWNAAPEVTQSFMIAVPLPLPLKVSGKFQFSGTAKDSCQIIGRLPSLAATQQFKDKTVTFDVGGAQAAFTLINAKGKAKPAAGTAGTLTLRLKYVKPRGAHAATSVQVSFSAKITAVRGTFLALWRACGFIPSRDAKKEKRPIAVNVIFDGVTYTATPSPAVTCSQKSKGGSFRTP